MGVSLADQQLAGDGMTEIGYYRIEGGESWAAKTPKISRNGDLHLYSNDIERGMDIFKFTAADRASERKGRWMSPAQATAFLAKAAEGGRDARERARLPAAAGPVVTLRRPGDATFPGAARPRRRALRGRVWREQQGGTRSA